MSSVIFSDFDGVLFNSVKEAYLLSRYAFDGVDASEKINPDEYLRFRKFRYLITHSIHFYYIFKLIKNNTPDSDFEKEYSKLSLENKLLDNALVFDDKYVQYRKFLIKNNYGFWNMLDEPFDFFFDFLKLSEIYPGKFLIITNKKRTPVEDKLIKFNAQHIKLIANEDLKPFKDKSDFIEMYLKNNNITQSVFIEDCVENLEHCSHIKDLTQVLVDWGYVSPRCKGFSRQQVNEKIKEIL